MTTLLAEPPYFDESRDDMGFTGLHFSNLFDQDEDAAGELYDLATGMRFNNSGDPDDIFTSISVGEAVTLGLIESEDSYVEDSYDKTYVDQWLKVQAGLAHAAGIELFEDADYFGFDDNLE